MNEHAHTQPAPFTTVVVVMGVSGAGKTTIGVMLAERLGCEFADGDWFHSAANIRKMRSGIPLTDEDRGPWLQGMAAWIDAKLSRKEGAVLACSVLKRSYRDIVIDDRSNVCLICLEGDRDLIARRQAARRGHFMPSTLLDSQFDTLEPPRPGEHPIVVSIEPRPHEIVTAIVQELERRGAFLATEIGNRVGVSEKDPE